MGRRFELVSALSVKLRGRHVSRSSRYARETRTQCLPQWILLIFLLLCWFYVFLFRKHKESACSGFTSINTDKVLKINWETRWRAECPESSSDWLIFQFARFLLVDENHGDVKYFELPRRFFVRSVNNSEERNHKPSRDQALCLMWNKVKDLTITFLTQSENFPASV